MDGARLRVLKITVILCAATGFALIFITPPFQVPDEGAHFFRAYQTSTLNLKLENRDGRAGADLPRALLDTRLLFDPIIGHPSLKVSRSLFMHALSIVDNSNTYCSVILPYIPVSYAASAIGICVGRAVSAAPIIYFYIARIMNFALFLLLIRWAIHWMPGMKWGLALLALMPMTLFEAASVSADAYAIGISFLMIAFLLRCAADEGLLRSGEIGFLFMGTALLASGKPGYSPLIFLALLIPKERFGTRTRQCMIFGGMLIIALAIGIASVLIMHGRTVGLPGSNSSEQLHVILAHPFVYLAVFFRCLFRASHFGSFIGNLGWLELPLPLWIVIPYGLLLIAVSYERRRALSLNNRQRLLVGAIFAVIVALIFATQYLAYTPVGKKSIDGMQGRYFIPCAPLFLLLFNSRRISFSIEDHAILRRAIIGFIILVHLTSAIMLIGRYYLPA
jgi:uncharacterized membrane protein